MVMMNAIGDNTNSGGGNLLKFSFVFPGLQTVFIYVMIF
jgi:hypothetical protein